MSEILTQDLGTNRVLAKFILQLLLPEQEEYRAAGANDLIQTTTTEPDFLKKVKTRDESWVYGYACDLETKAPLSQQKAPYSPCPRKAQQSRSNIKTMLTVFLIGKVLPITSMLLQAKQLMRSAALQCSLSVQQ